MVIGLMIGAVDWLLTQVDLVYRPDRLNIK